jgi:AcrR family transcriptional regulator
MGSPEAKNRAALLDAAEQIMLEEGYPAATSRRVAEKAGLKHQLVHYYFHGMDELFTACFRRSAERGLRVQAEALKSPQPLWALWRWHTSTVNAPLWTEYIAMANHRKGLRAEIVYYSKRFREEQRWIVERALKAYGVDPDELPGRAATVLLTSVSRVLVMEEALEVLDGHAETVEIVERYLRQLEATRPSISWRS